jgi:heme oxygenase (mycobilin-producing)
MFAGGEISPGSRARWVADRVIVSCCGMVRSAVVRHDRWMTIIKINAIRVLRESGDELAHRFAARAGAVDDADGFQGYELLKPTDDRDQWLVITRWRDEESFQAWLGSESFTQGHRSAAERQGGTTPKPVASHSEVPTSSPVGLTSFWIGCHADRPELAELIGDDIAVRARRIRSTGGARHSL